MYKVISFVHFQILISFAISCNQFLKQEPHEFLRTMKQGTPFFVSPSLRDISSCLFLLLSNLYQIRLSHHSDFFVFAFLLWHWGLQEGTLLLKGKKHLWISIKFVFLPFFCGIEGFVLPLDYERALKFSKV